MPMAAPSGHPSPPPTRTPTVFATSVEGGRERIAKKLGRRRSLAMPMYADAVLGCFTADGDSGGARSWDAKAEEVREGGGEETETRRRNRDGRSRKRDHSLRPPTRVGRSVGRLVLCVAPMHIFPNIERASRRSYGGIFFPVIMRARERRARDK